MKKSVLISLTFFTVLSLVNGLYAQCTFGATDDDLGEDYVLVWADEFSIGGAVCSENWFHQTQLPNGGSWFNGELQHYTDELANSSVSNGSLKITAIKEQYRDQGQTKSYTSARLNSKFAFTYGRVDVRAKLPSGSGTWPAIWTLGQNITERGGYWANEYGTTPWPATGEIDIMEHWGYEPNVVHGSLHTSSSSGATVNTRKTTVPNVSAQFHVYSIIWDRDKIEFLVNDEAFYTYSPPFKDAFNWPFDEPQYILLNIAMGGIGGSIDPSFTSSSMEIDYVRIYQKAGDYIIPEPDPVLLSPESVADVPDESSSAVISIFGDTYSNMAVDSWLAEGSDADYGLVNISGDQVIEYENLTTAIIDISSNPLDISGMNVLHMDIWTPNSTQLQLGLFDFGSNGISDGRAGDDSFDEVTFSTQTTGQWNSYYFQLSAFSNLNSKNSLGQLFISSKPEGESTLYLDNIYFLNSNGPLAVAKTINRPVFTLKQDELKVDFVSSVTIYDYQLLSLTGKVLLERSGNNEPSKSLKIQLSQPGLQLIKIATDQGVITHKFFSK